MSDEQVTPPVPAPVAAPGDTPKILRRMKTLEEINAARTKVVGVMKDLAAKFKTPSGGTIGGVDGTQTYDAGVCTTSGVSPCKSDVLLASAMWGSVYLGVVVGFAFEESCQDVVIRAELSTSPDCRAPIARDIVCTMSFLVPPPIDPVANGCVPEIITIQAQEADCLTCRTYQLGLSGIGGMVPRGYARAFNRDTPPAIFTQTFVYVGSMDTQDPITITN